VNSTEAICAIDKTHSLDSLNFHCIENLLVRCSLVKTEKLKRHPLLHYLIMQNKHTLFLVSISIVLLLATIFVLLNGDYQTSLRSANTSLPSSTTSEPAQTKLIINQDGTKMLIIEGSVSFKFTTDLGGRSINGRKYNVYIIAKWLQEFSSDLLKQLRKDNGEIILIFLAISIIPAILLFRRKISGQPIQ